VLIGRRVEHTVLAPRRVEAVPAGLAEEERLVAEPVDAEDGVRHLHNRQGARVKVCRGRRVRR
jgi:hypothetical protein